MANILILDDIESFAITLSEHFQTHGHTAQHVLYAGKALENVETNQYDFIIIDGSEDVEVRPGRTLTDVLKELYPSITRVALTGVHNPYDDPILQEKYDIILSKWSEIQRIYQMMGLEYNPK